MKKLFLIVVLLLILICVSLVVWIVIPHLRALPVPPPLPSAPEEMIGFSLAKPNLLVNGRGLAKVEIWAIPTGTGITEKNYSLLGQASLDKTTGGVETWLFPIPVDPVLATGIFAEGFDRDGVKVGEIPLPYSGATDLYNAIWGSEVISANEIREYDSGRAFAYGLNERFSLILDSGKYPAAELACAPSGVISAASNSPTAKPTLYAAVFAAVATGTCELKDKDFTATVKIYDPSAASVKYANKAYGFELEYSPENFLSDQFEYGYVTDNLLLRLNLPANYYADTNLSEASLFVGATTSPAVVKQCLIPAPEETKATGTKIINGSEFTVFPGFGIGAGNRYDTTSYRVVRNKTCYEIVTLLHYGEILNYPPGVVKEFDRPEVFSKLESIAKSFVFTK